MNYDFDTIIDRRPTESVKWHLYGEDVLPLWVADMDFRSPEPVIRALRDRVDHGIFGYGMEPPALRRVITDRLEDLYGWTVAPDSVLFLPGVIAGFNLAIRAVTSPGDGILAQTPVYYPILHAPPNAGCTLEEMQLTLEPDGTYSVDLDAFEAAITGRTRVFVLCNPHNPVGRVFRRDELEGMAEICLRHNVVICADEIHCDLMMAGNQHLPIASLDPNVAARTITLLAPSKTFNIAGLNFSFAIVQDPGLRTLVTRACAGLVPHHLNLLGLVAAEAAYTEGQPWLDAVLRYMEDNCDYLLQFLDERMPRIRMAKPEGTYLAWLDCREAGLPGNPHKFFLERGSVAVNDGAAFGQGGEGFVRLNFGCPRATLVEALERMAQAVAALG